jgi:hypothetical protein
MISSTTVRCRCAVSERATLDVVSSLRRTPCTRLCSSTGPSLSDPSSLECLPSASCVDFLVRLLVKRPEKALKMLRLKLACGSR